MNFTQLLRMVRWVRHPPSWRRVQLIAAVIVICLVIVAIEWLGFWPEWATSPYQRGPGARP